MNLIQAMFDSFHKVFVFCPDCDAVFRLSDAQMFKEDKAPSDFLSKLEKQIQGMESQISKAEEKLNEKRSIIRQQEARKMQLLVNKKIDGIIPGMKLAEANSRDLKTIGYPIKFISFDGKDERHVKRLRFIDFEPNSKSQEVLQKSLESTVKKGNYDWETLKVSEEGKLEKG